MVSSNWVNLEDQIIGQKYRLVRLIEPGSQEAWFSAEAVDAGARSTTFVIAVSTRQGAGAIRPDELRHPNLRRVFASGADTVQGLEIRYVVLENVGESLAEVLRQGPLDENAAGELALEVVSALDHLHGRGFVYAGLRPSAVARSDRGWVLSDFDLLRRKGSVDPSETRLMLAASPHVPPDAYGGLVSPAWDLWSLGVVLNQALTGAPERTGRRTKPSPAPPPFDSIIRGCLDPDPNERIGLRDVAGLLGTELHSRSARLARPPELPPSPAAQPLPPPPAAPTDGLAVEEARENKADPQPVVPATGRVAQRRRSRIYSAPAVEPPLRTSSPDPDPIPSRWDSIGQRGRMWAIVALGVLALSLGVLLAVLNARERRDTANAEAGELQTQAERSGATPATQEIPPDPPPPVVDPAARKAAIIPFLFKWARTMRELELDQHVDTYAPVVDIFFTKRAVPLSEVRAEKQKLFSGISEVRRLSVRTIRIQSFQPDRAVVTLRKDWDLRGPRPTAGAERERLTLQWINGEWRITGEQEIVVYWTKKPRATKGD